VRPGTDVAALHTRLGWCKRGADLGRRQHQGCNDFGGPTRALLQWENAQRRECQR